MARKTVYKPNVAVLAAVAKRADGATFADLRGDDSLASEDVETGEMKPFGGTSTLTSLVKNGYLEVGKKTFMVTVEKEVSVYTLTDKGRAELGSDGTEANA